MLSIIQFQVAAISLLLLTTIAGAQSFNKADWKVRTWNSAKRIWEDKGLDMMTITQNDGVAKVANTSGIHRHAHLVFPKSLKGDFKFTIELMGGYELGWLNRAGKDEMLYVEIGETNTFETYELSRTGTRFEIKCNGRVRPMVHFRFDYGEDSLITLAIKQNESAEIRSCRFEDLN